MRPTAAFSKRCVFNAKIVAFMQSDAAQCCLSCVSALNLVYGNLAAALTLDRYGRDNDKYRSR
jgi:hypothetical protein